MPQEVADAQLILGLCERFHCRPSEILAEGSHLLYLLNVEHMAKEN